MKKHQTTNALFTLLFGACACTAALQALASESSTVQSATNTLSAPHAGTNTSPAALPAQFEATIYEIEALTEPVQTLKAKALEKQAGTAESLLKALSKTGTARILYRFDQPVNVRSQELFMGKSQPYPTVGRTNGGYTQMQMLQVGASVRLSSPPTTGEHPQVKVAVELQTLGFADVEIAPGQKSPITRNLTSALEATLEFGQPRVMLAVESASPDKKQPPAIYVIRFLFSR